MSKRDEQLARMKGLMTYGMVSENKKTPVKDSIEGPDGNVYAIIREGAKYYIKSTPKGSALVTESFDYIGGFMNKKANEFTSYNQASKNLELKVRSLNEAYGVNKTVEILNPEKKETLMVEMTDAMKASLARYRQIMNNAAGIMNESAISSSNTGVPEAPKTTGFSPKLGEPFTDKAEAKLDTDLKATASDPEKQGEPFGDKEKAEDYKDAQYVPDGSVANKKPSGGKVVRVNENEEYEETIEECDEWGSCGLPASAGVGEIGDDAPFEETVSAQLEESSDFVGFADDETTNEGEDEEDVDLDLDDIDIDLDSEEPAADDDIDDIDTEDDDLDFEDDEEIELDDEDDIEALKDRVAELEDLVAQLLGDENELDDEDEEFDSELEEDEDFFHNPNVPDDEQLPPPPAEVRFPEMMRESKHIVQRIVEDVVQYVNDKSKDGMGPDETETFRYREKTDAKHPNGPIVTILKRIGDWESEEIAELESSAAAAESPEEKSRIERNISRIKTRYAYATNCAKNIKRLLSNIAYYEKSDEATPEIMDELAASLNKEFKRLTANIGTNNDPAIESLGNSIDNILDRIEAMFDMEPDVDLGVEGEDDFDYVDDYENQEDEFGGLSDDEMDAMAWKGAGDYDPSDLELASVTPRRLNEEGTRLNVFGKHPGYRKKPMTLPATGSDEGDWNDDSVYSEQPFGQEIGDSAPFEKVIKASVDAIMESLKKKL